ncbi:MAG: glycosyltransferase [Rickettsiales bacterium]|nr:glycosyltransferase [Rickettsiales bacterium]
MKLGLGIFAKTAEVSPVKTRLAAGIGVEKAKEFYALSVQAVEATVQALPASITAYWAVAEEAGINHPQWKNLDCFWTGEGDLGQCLHQVYCKLKHEYGAAMLMGTDSPQLSPQVIEGAAEALSNSVQKCIIGPCEDGGFYLFAAAIEIPQEVWLAVEYSQDSTLEQLVTQLAKYEIEVEFLPEEQDVDTAEDLQNLYEDLLKQSNLSPSQSRLLDWLN